MRSGGELPDTGDHRMDALLWAVVPALVLTVVGVGAVNGDAIRHANSFVDGSWGLNPNHLVMEPVAAAWFQLASELEWGASHVDRLKLLDIWAGGVALGLFRLLVAPAVAERRMRRNLSTLVLGGLQAFIAYWISGEPIILQVVVLVLAAHCLIRFVQAPGVARAVWTGAGFALAALFFVSNAVVGAFTLAGVSVWSSVRTDETVSFRHAGGFLLGAAGLGMAGMLAGWMAAAPGTDLWTWVTSYAGEVSLGDHVFGVEGLAPGNLAEATTRAVYGMAIAFVDVAPTVDAARGQISWGMRPAVAPIAAASVGVALLYCLYRSWRAEGQPRMLAAGMTGWVVGVIAFGIVYNNSDSQYFVQIAVPAAVLVAAVPENRRSSAPDRLALLALAASVVWNFGSAFTTQISYPRSKRLDRLGEEVRGGSLVIYPGADTVGRLLHLLPDTLYEQRLSMMTWSDRYRDDGLDALADSIRRVLARGGDLRIVGVYDAPDERQPWSILARRGYTPAKVTGLFAEYSAAPLDSTGYGFGTRKVPGHSDGLVTSTP